MYASARYGNATDTNITAAERGLRTLAGAALMFAVVAGAAPSPAMIFILCTLGLYMMHTALSGTDPVYALAGRLRVADRLQVWHHTLATAALSPVVIAGDLISAFTVFLLSALGGFLATAAIVGRDVAAALGITKRGTDGHLAAAGGAGPARKEASLVMAP